MKRYLLGCLLPLVATLFVAMLLPRSGWWWAPRGDAVVVLGAVLVALPLGIAWITAEGVHLVRPRRLFRGRRRATVRLIATGLATGLAAMALAGVGLAFGDRWLPDGVIVASAALVASLVGVLALPRHRRGHCIYCRYDLRGATLASGGCCTECGREIVPA